MVPPYELKNKEFSKVMRGYNPVEVDEHIGFIIEKYTELYRENDELERKIKTAYAKLDEIKNEEESIRSAMVNAQRASAKIMNEANDRADIIINTARKSCDRILSDFRKKIQEERAVLVALNDSITEFKDKLFKTYNSHISFIEDIKLLDESEIVKYALSDENFTACVVQNIKQDIVETSKEEEKQLSFDEPVTDTSFVEANYVTQEPVVRSTNVKDTIKQLNKRFGDDSGDKEGEAVVFDEKIEESPSEAELEAEKEYGEMLKQLGVSTSPIDVVDDKKTAKKRDFDKAYETPENYGETVKKRFKKK